VKEGFNATLTKHFHVAASLLSTAVLTAVTFYIYYNHDENDTHIGKKNFPTYKSSLPHPDTTSSPSAAATAPTITSCRGSRRNPEASATSPGSSDPRNTYNLIMRLFPLSLSLLLLALLLPAAAVRNDNYELRRPIKYFFHLLELKAGTPSPTQTSIPSSTT
jgi:hypothetical protein